MLVRYRYRIDPTSAQRHALARASGCARVVYNDALAERHCAYRAGEWISDTEVQRRVITQAERTPERAWLTEVASVALVQACQDARRAYRNWFDSLKGKRKVAGSGTQGFGPSTAASRSGSPVTASRSTGPDCMWPRSARCVCVSRTAGIDLGLIAFATIATGDGTVETLANPRLLRAAERRLARAQRQLSRKQNGSKNLDARGIGCIGATGADLGGPSRSGRSSELCRRPWRLMTLPRQVVSSRRGRATSSRTSSADVLRSAAAARHTGIAGPRGPRRTAPFTVSRP